MTDDNVTEEEAYNRGYDYGVAFDMDGYRKFVRNLPAGSYGTGKPDPLSAAHRGWNDGWCEESRSY